MKETIASTWIYQLVIVFILIFVSFLILALTYSKAFKNKNELIDILEKYEGVNTTSIKLINNYLNYNGYKVKGTCPSNDDWYGVMDLTEDYVYSVKSDTKYYYCVKREVKDSKSFYRIKVFFKFNIPVIGDIKTFTIDGTTNLIFKNSNEMKNVR